MKPGILITVNISFLMLFLMLFLILSLPLPAHAEPRVHDDLVQPGKMVLLKASHGGLLKKGGRMLEFFVDENSLGSTLSGGDAVAYMRYEPKIAGVFDIQVRLAGESASGLLVAASHGSRVLVVDASGVLMDALGKDKTKGRSLNDASSALSEISGRWIIIYAHDMLGSFLDIKGYLSKHEFPRSPVMSMKGLIKKLLSRGFVVDAVIGSAGVLKAIRQDDIQLIGFDKIEGARRISSWSELEEALMEQEIVMEPGVQMKGNR